MATSVILYHHLSNAATILISIFFLSTTTVSSLEFQVGDNSSSSATGSNSYYDRWATHNRFHVGDSLNFVYGSKESDSVLLVNSTAYSNCTVSDPILRLNGGGGRGNATFQFDRPGLFYFISGQAENCLAGQKLVVRVMTDKDKDEEGQHDYGPSPAPGGNDGDLVWDWPPAVNSTVKMTIASYFITALAGVLVILYLLM